MNLETVQLPKCASVYCNNILKSMPKKKRGLDRFCLACLHSNYDLSWECLKCGKAITGNRSHVSTLYCKECKRMILRQRDKERYDANKFVRFVQRLAKRKCRRCQGKIAQPFKRDYCTAYCYWINRLRHRNRRIKKQMADVK